MIFNSIDKKCLLLLSCSIIPMSIIGCSNKTSDAQHKSEFIKETNQEVNKESGNEISEDDLKNK